MEEVDSVTFSSISCSYAVEIEVWDEECMEYDTSLMFPVYGDLLPLTEPEDKLQDTSFIDVDTVPEPLEASFSSEFDLDDGENKENVEPVETVESAVPASSVCVPAPHYSFTEPTRPGTPCAVCGEKSSSVTLRTYLGCALCSACKSFELRHRTGRNKGSLCTKEGRCEITEFNRTLCAPCRYLKLLLMSKTHPLHQTMKNKELIEKKAVGTVKAVKRGKMKEDPEPEEYAMAVDSVLDTLDPIGHSDSSSEEANNNNSVGEEEPWVPWLLLPPRIGPYIPNKNLDSLQDMLGDYLEEKKYRSSMLRESLEDLLSLTKGREGGGKLGRGATFEDFSRIFSVQMELLFQWAQKQHHFQMLEEHEKARILRLFIFPFVIMETAFNSLLHKTKSSLVLVNGSAIHRTTIVGREAMPTDFDREIYIWAQDLVVKCVRQWRNSNLRAFDMVTIRAFAFYDLFTNELNGEDTIDAKVHPKLAEIIHDFASNVKGTNGLDTMILIKTRLKLILQPLRYLKSLSLQLYTICSKVPGFSVFDEEWKRHLNDRIFVM